MKFTDAIKLTTLLILTVGVSLCSAQPQSQSPNADDPDRWKQEYLFMLKDAYVLDPGHMRVSMMASYWQNLQLREWESGVYQSYDRDQLLGVGQLELGLMPGVQLDAALPFGYAEQDYNGSSLNKSDVGDIRTGVTVQLIEQDHNSWLPTVSFRGGAIIPFGNSRRSFDKDASGWEAEFMASKAFDDFFWHGNFSYRSLTNTNEFGQTNKADEQLWKGGLALVYSPKMGYEVMCEASYGNEREDAVQTRYRQSCYITPGFNVTLAPNTQFGAGMPIGIGDANYDWGVILKLQVGF